jgi:hypothetical protein
MVVSVEGAPGMKLTVTFDMERNVVVAIDDKPISCIKKCFFQAGEGNADLYVQFPALEVLNQMTERDSVLENIAALKRFGCNVSYAIKETE